MKILLFQLKYAVNEAEYKCLQEKTLPLENISGRNAIASISKEFDVGELVIPPIGSYICDTFWQKEFWRQKIINITFSSPNRACTATLEPFVTIEGSTFHRTLKERAEAHGWAYQGL